MQIRFQDCDPLNHLNNSKYLDYFMNAREDHLSKYYGVDIYERFKRTGKSWVVAKNEIIYRKPVFLMEKVLISSQVIKFSLKHLEVQMTMYNEEGIELKALLRTILIPFDMKTNAVTEHEDEIMKLLESIHVEKASTSIEEELALLEGK